MATLFNTKISATYEGLLKTIDNAAITATLKELTDGSGNQSGLYLNTAGDFKVSSVLEWGSLKDTGTGVTITQFVTAANGIENFNNDTTIPTSAAVKLYVDSNGGSSNWSLSGNNIYNSNSGNVGIGTVTPLYKLHTVGSVRIEGTITLGGNVNNFIAGTGSEVIFKTANDYTFTKGASTVLKINSSGNVGIGTTTPTDKLEVAGNINLVSTSNYIKFANDLVRIQRLANGLNFDSYNGFKFYDTQFSSERLRIDSAGNVGIGTTSPAQKFHLSGGIARFHNVSSNYLDIDGSDAGSNHVIIQNRFNQIQIKTNSGVGTPHISLLPGTGGNVGIGTSSPTEKLEVAGKAIIRRTGSATIHADTDLFVTDATASGSAAQIQILSGNAGGCFLYFSDTDSYSQGAIQYLHSSDSMNFRVNASTAMSINSSRNVGIGTSAPSEKLEVNGNIKLSSIGTGNSASSYGMLFYGTTTSGSQTDQAKIHSSPWSSNSNAGNLQLYTSNASNVITERLRIDGAGNVGIGTTTPTEKLHILNAAAAIKIDSTTNESILKYENSTSTASIKLANNDLKTELGGSEVTRILANGNVGIGTTAPSAKLEVYATTGITSESPSNAVINIRRNDNTAYSSLLKYFSGNTEKWVAGLSDSGDFTNSSGEEYFIGTSKTTPNLLINSTGNVGIGDTSPSSKLSVLGDSSTSNIPIARVVSSSSVSNIHFLTSSTGSNSATDGFYVGVNGTTAYIINRESTSLYLGTNGNVNQTILSNGNVGIGTTNPQGALEVYNSETGVFFRRSADPTNQFLKFTTDAASNRIEAGEKPFIINTTDAKPIQLATNNSTRLSIDSTGNVGIGTTSPGSKLHIDESSTVTAALFISTARYGISLQGAGTSNSQYLLNLQSNNGANDVLRVQSSGNIGIGTNSPNEKLEVEGGDIKIKDASAGLILTSPNGTVYKITVANDGTVTSTAV